MKKRMTTIALSLLLMLAVVIPVSAATYVSGNLSNGVGKSANGSLSWNQGSGMARATTNGSGCYVQAQLKVRLIKRGGGYENYYSSFNGANNSVSASKSGSYSGFEWMQGSHNARYGNGYWSAGTSW